MQTRNKKRELEFEEKHLKNKRKLISGGITLLFHLLVVVLLLVLGLQYQVPPPAEQGVEISAEELTEASVAMTGQRGGDFSQNKTPNATKEDADNFITQEVDDAPIKSKPYKPRVVKETENKKPTTENDALFPGKKSPKGNGEGSGVGVGKGEDGKGGAGTSNYSDGYSLNGRSAKFLPKPESNKKETGNVVVIIEVDQEGRVISARAGGKGTTIMDTNIWRKCEQAAKKAKFSPKADAPEKQRGTITYHFVN